MSDIFISYSSADRHKAKLLADVLLARGWAVWWDRTIPPGKTFDEVIEEALDSAKCIIVLWTKTSTSSNWVKAEAGEGLRRQILVPVLLEDVRIPLEFRRIQAADLSGWQGELSGQELDKLLIVVQRLLDGPVRGENIEISRDLKIKAENVKDIKQVINQGSASKGPEEFPTGKNRAPKKLSFIIGGLIGAVVGFPVGIMANHLLGSLPADNLATGGIVSVAAALVGALCRNDRSLLSAGAIGAVMGGIIWAIFDHDLSDRAIRSVALGGPAGAILGSVGAIYWKAIRKK
jgi:hypothetical protein